MQPCRMKTKLSQVFNPGDVSDSSSDFATKSVPKTKRLKRERSLEDDEASLSDEE